jgi:hypothetical protein
MHTCVACLQFVPGGKVACYMFCCMSICILWLPLFSVCCISAWHVTHNSLLLLASLGALPAAPAAAAQPHQLLGPALSHSQRQQQQQQRGRHQRCALLTPHSSCLRRHATTAAATSAAAATSPHQHTQGCHQQQQLLEPWLWCCVCRWLNRAAAAARDAGCWHLCWRVS